MTFLCPLDLLVVSNLDFKVGPISLPASFFFIIRLCFPLPGIDLVFLDEFGVGLLLIDKNVGLSLLIFILEILIKDPDQLPLLYRTLDRANAIEANAMVIDGRPNYDQSTKISVLRTFKALEPTCQTGFWLRKGFTDNPGGPVPVSRAFEQEP